MGQTWTEIDKNRTKLVQINKIETKWDKMGQFYVLHSNPLTFTLKLKNGGSKVGVDYKIGLYLFLRYLVISLCCYTSPFRFGPSLFLNTEHFFVLDNIRDRTDLDEKGEDGMEATERHKTDENTGWGPKSVHFVFCF